MWGGGGAGLREADITCCGCGGPPGNGGLLPLHAHPIPPCNLTGTPTNHASKGKRQSCGSFTWDQLSQSIRTAAWKIQTWSSGHRRAAMLTSHTTSYNLRTPCWLLAFREHTIPWFCFPVAAAGLLFLFWFGICPSPFTLGFSEASLWPYFLIFDTFGFFICYSAILVGIRYLFS